MYAQTLNCYRMTLAALVVTGLLSYGVILLFFSHSPVVKLNPKP